jgi:hypothetical protein
MAQFFGATDTDLARRIMARFGRKVHVRSVERALAPLEKKRP